MSSCSSSHTSDRRRSNPWYAHAIGTTVVVLLSVVSAKAGAAVAERFATGLSAKPSIEERVASIRANVQERTARGASTRVPSDKPAQVAWKNG
jgi:hypothetical protein